MVRNHNLESATQRLLDSSPLIRDEYNRVLTYWSPDAPPATVVFASIGRRLSDDIHDLGDSENASIWSEVEELICHGEDTVKNAVATGLVESVLNQMSGGRIDPKSFVRFFGPETMVYAEAWNSFSGCKIDGIG